MLNFQAINCQVKEFCSFLKGVKEILSAPAFCRQIVLFYVAVVYFIVVKCVIRVSGNSQA